MGIFGGSFGSGFVTGLAQSVDKNLQLAIDRRNEDLSEAKKYTLQMQRAKAERADERDTRAEKALDRMIKEAGGNVAMGLAAYNAAGGEVEQVEGFLANLDETRGRGMEYNLADKLDLQGVDLTQFKDLTRERAFASIRTEVRPVTTLNLEDTSGLQKIGLGMENMGAGISKSVNDMIPAREREAIDGIVGAALDRSGMAKSADYQRELEASAPSLKTQLGNNLNKIRTGQDLMGKTLSESEITELELQNAKLIGTIGSIAKAEAAATDTGPTLTELSSLYSSGLSKLQTDLGFDLNSTTGIMTIAGPDGILEGPSAQAYWKKQKDQFKLNFVRNSIFDTSGNYISNDADFAAKALGLGDIANTVRTDILGADKPKDDDDPDPLKLNFNT